MRAVSWLYLLAAGIMEIGFALGLKYAQGFTRLWPSVWTVGAAAVSLYCLSRALREIPIGTGYAVWTGIGAAGTAILGIVLFAEPRDWPRVLSILLILAGVIGLRMFSPEA